MTTSFRTKLCTFVSPSASVCASCACIHASASQRAPGGAGQTALPAPVPAQRRRAPLPLLPLDARLRAREVCRGWRFFLKGACFWQFLFFSEAAAESLTVDLTWGLVRAAIARAKGTLHTLNLSAVRDVLLSALGVLVAENGESLRWLKTPKALFLGAENVARLRQAAPLCKLLCNVVCVGAEAVALLGCELVCPFDLQVDELDTEQQQTDFAAALATRNGIRELYLTGGNLAGGAALMDLARAIVAAGVGKSVFFESGLTQLALPALPLLLRSNVLWHFGISNDGVPLFTGPDLAFCDALRSNSIPDEIFLHNCDLWANPADAGMVLAALAARTELEPHIELNLPDNNVGETQEEQFASGTQLAQIITAAGLVALNISGCNLGEAGLGPIFQALPRASRLWGLQFDSDTLSSEFARDVVLPAVRANNSLRSLTFCNEDEDDLLPELIEAQNIVKARN